MRACFLGLTTDSGRVVRLRMDSDGEIHVVEGQASESVGRSIGELLSKLSTLAGQLDHGNGRTYHGGCIRSTTMSDDFADK